MLRAPSPNHSCSTDGEVSSSRIWPRMPRSSFQEAEPSNRASPARVPISIRKGEVGSDRLIGSRSAAFRRTASPARWNPPSSDAAPVALSLFSAMVKACTSMRRPRMSSI
jgi:hypothetical protein